jgi:L-2-hydroxyglutarate oxidase LhgO
MDKQDVLVIGAGVVGLAIARLLAMYGRDVLVVEKAASFGTETSSRNSEVIHSGIYYPAGSLKALSCVQGAAKLYEYCQIKSVPYRRVGKLIVATESAQQERLRTYLAQGQKNGVEGLDIISADELSAREPDVRGVAALWSPHTGILDSHGYMLSLINDLEKSAGQVVYKTEVVSGFSTHVGTELQTSDGYKFMADTVINAAGLSATDVSLRLGVDAESVPVTRYARGRYYQYTAKSTFAHLVYPLATNASLGVHVTMDMGGELRFGPDVEWIEQVDYSFKGDAVDSFTAAIKSYFPALQEEYLCEGYTGIRPKVVAKGEEAGDFIVHEPEQTGCQGVYALYGIESPGLTASLALAEFVANLVGK